jgi:hypothetical protein
VSQPPHRDALGDLTLAEDPGWVRLAGFLVKHLQGEHERTERVADDIFAAFAVTREYGSSPVSGSPARVPHRPALR